MANEKAKQASSELKKQLLEAQKEALKALYEANVLKIKILSDLLKE